MDAHFHPLFLVILLFFFLFFLFFTPSSPVSKPPLTRADTLSVLVRLHSVPSRSLEKSHPSFFSPFPGGHLAYHVWNPHTDGKPW